MPLPHMSTCEPSALKAAEAMGVLGRWTACSLGFSAPSARKRRSVLSRPAVSASLPLGCHWTMVHYLRSGRRKPGRALGEAIRRQLGVDPVSWDEPPTEAATEGATGGEAA